MSNPKIVVFGAGGIIGQHMIRNCPKEVNAVFTTTTGISPYKKFDIKYDDVEKWLNNIDPDIIINLAGENTVDKVESDPNRYYDVNVSLPLKISRWVKNNKKKFIQVSTQGVFGGENAPYEPESTPDPITFYGRQKALAEDFVLQNDGTKVVRSTFVLGVRPDQSIGRKNPLEFMFENYTQTQVDDRFFSPVFATDVAQSLWDIALNFSLYSEKIMHLGNPITCSRYSIAKDVQSIVEEKLEVTPASYLDFPSHVKRPKDTTWKENTSIFITNYLDGIREAYNEWKSIKK